MKLSVVITSFNFKEYIEECVDSIINQNIGWDYEIIISDDASKDNSKKILQDRYSNVPNIKLHFNDNNIGAVNNIKLSFEQCKGEYIFFLDGDDYLIDTSYINRAITFLDENKKYSMYCSGYKFLKNKEIFPTDYFYIPLKSDVYLKDMYIDQNYISFGRVFRNYKNIVQDWMNDLYYPDWAINCEILKNGPAKCEQDRYVGIYRITGNGMLTGYSEEEKHKRHVDTLNKMKEKYSNKTINIIDCFVHNDRIREKLSNCIDNLKSSKNEILLITNTTVDQSVVEKIDYLFYDKNDRLFNPKNYEHDTVDLYKIFDDFEIHNIVPNVQKNGLSVLINLFRSLTIAKNLGYTHFQRFEVDDLYGEESLKKIIENQEMCIQENKKGIFYVNKNNNPPDFSFHYMFCEIDFFLKQCENIFSEEDYISFIKKHKSSKKFVIVEEYMYLNLINSSDLILKNGSEMYSDFPDTSWNTENSVSHNDEKYNKCVTKIYSIRKNGNDESNYAIFSYNYSSELKNRKIIVKNKDGMAYTLNHSLSDFGYWQYNIVDENIQSIDVYENDKFLYSEDLNELSSYLIFKK